MFKQGRCLSPSLRRAILVIPIWLFCAFWMWHWWFSSSSTFLPLYIPLSAAILYEFLFLPAAFLYFVIRAKRPPRRVAPKNQKVAIITLCVPLHESISVIETQLKNMSIVEYPHDSWILDEGNDPRVKRLAKIYGVKYFTRFGKKKYNQPDAPYKAKTKAGNVNAWLDHVKKYEYDYFVQLDIDHLPIKKYLHKTLGYFRDSRVAWVQAPSVYKNTESSWTARASCEQELVLQGPLQMGFYGHSETPFIIGSHCTYRMSAIREIGGFQPTRAEDHLDTVALASRGWKGVYHPEIIAEGDGPESLDTYLSQQYAWAFSMFQVLVGHSPRLLRTMPWRKKLQFLFAQTWYPLWSISYMIMFLIPLASVVLGKPVLSTSSNEFIIHFLPMFLVSFLVWWAGRPLMLPKKIKLTWRGVLLHGIRWPVILKAVLGAAMRRTKPYMITPKGRTDEPLTARLYAPFLLLSVANALTVIGGLMFNRRSFVDNQVWFLTINQLFMLSVCLVDANLRLRRLQTSFRSIWRRWVRPLAAITASIIISVASISASIFVKQETAFAKNSNLANISSVELVPFESMSLVELKDYLSSGDELRLYPHNSGGLGMYDPARNMSSQDKNFIRLSFIDWRNDKELAIELSYAKRLNSTPLVTLMPITEKNDNQLYPDILSGKYDERISKVFDVLKKSKRTVYIRFAHEMDLGELYTWGAKNPLDFIRAYRRIITSAKAQGITNVRWVWSPAGNPNASLYYPGDDVVDVIGTTLLYDEVWYGNSKPNFFQFAEFRRWLVSYGKPVWIVEFGVSSDDAGYKTFLINDALNNYQRAGFSAIIYINIKDSNMLGPDYTLLDVKQFAPDVKVIGGSLGAIRIRFAVTNINEHTVTRNAVKPEKVVDHRSILQSLLDDATDQLISYLARTDISDSRDQRAGNIENEKPKDRKTWREFQVSGNCRLGVGWPAVVVLDYCIRTDIEVLR